MSEKGSYALGYWFLIAVDHETPQSLGVFRADFRDLRYWTRRIW